MTKQDFGLERQGPDFDAPVRNQWYAIALASSVRAGTTRREMLLGDPLVLGRAAEGRVFALRDICPHRGVPLSAGRLRADGTIECPYHGWRFRHDGVCGTVPSLVEGQSLDLTKICVRRYLVVEQDGLIWIYMPVKGAETALPNEEPARVPLLDARPRWSEIQTFSCGIDHAVIGLMDPVHAAFVHRHWWWRRKIAPKEKRYLPTPTGFVMVRHRPSKPAYKLLGDVTTEISFALPSTRFETVEGHIFGRHFRIVSLTLCTPRDPDHTDVIQVLYWPWWLGVIKPFFLMLGRSFIADDRKIVELQREGLRFDPALMLIQDADMPAIWYHRIKKAWIESTHGGPAFLNPITARVLRWRS